MGMVELTSGDVWRVQHLSLGAHETGDGLQEADLDSPRAAFRWPACRVADREVPARTHSVRCAS